MRTSEALTGRIRATRTHNPRPAEISCRSQEAYRHVTETLSIDQLPQLVAKLPDDDKRLVERLYQIVATRGQIVPPPEMEPWLERTFGSVAATREQQIIRVMNRWTFEGSTFNPLRASRPGSGTTQQPAAVPPEVRERIERARGDDFCDPEHKTPADSFGRVRGAHIVTASNVAKADGWHGVGVFDRHDPLAIDDALVADVLATGADWALRARERDGGARHFFLLWNCLWRAGASLIHGHMQMTLSHEMAHAGVERLRAAADHYRHAGGADYFGDVTQAHRAFGLTADVGAVTRFASLTPVKEREVVMLAPGDEPDPRAALSRFAEPLARTIHTAMEGMGVRSFNVVVYGPPLDARAGEGWEGFPWVARFVDRGNPLSPTSDIAGLELYGSSVISADPFDVARALRGM